MCDEQTGIKWENLYNNYFPNFYFSYEKVSDLFSQEKCSVTITRESKRDPTPYFTIINFCQ